DLPGYGYARGGREAAHEFEALTRAYFERDARTVIGALLLVDARHPGLASDRQAWAWVAERTSAHAGGATEIDKLSRAGQATALTELESVFEDSVLPVSAVTGEGLDELWTLIDRLANSSRDAATAPRHPRKK